MFLARQLSIVASGRRVPGRGDDSDDCNDEVDVDDANRTAAAAPRHRVSSNISAVSSYSTESSATDASVNSGKDYDSDVFHQYSTGDAGDDLSIDDPEVVLKSVLANAWFQKRAIMKSEPRVAAAAAAATAASLYGGAILLTADDSRSGPVDLDEHEEAYFDSFTSPQQLLESDEEPPFDGDLDAASSSSGASDGDETGLGNSEWSSYDALQGRHDVPNLSSLLVDSSILSSANAHLLFTHCNEYDRASIVSASTSDMTPVVCNVSPGASPSRQRHLKSGDPLDEIRESATDKKRWTIQEFYNCRTYQGKVALLLALILILAVVTIVVSSQVTQRSRVGNAISNTTGSGSSDVSLPTIAPSQSALRTTRPTAPLVLETRPTQSPPEREESPIAQTSAPSAAPTDAFEGVFWSPIDTLGDPTQQSSPTEPAMFGSAVAMSANANLLVVAARDATVDGHDRAGLVHVFERDAQANGSSTLWILRASVAGRASQDGTGTAVAISEDGSLLALGEPGNDQGGDRVGSVRTFRYDAESENYVPLAKELLGPGLASYFGASLALAGRRLVVGAPAASDTSTRLAGMVQVYELTDDETEWRVISTMFGTDESDWLGSAVDITGDGLLVAASAPENAGRKGYVRVWGEVAGQWGSYGDIANDFRSSKSDDRFGHSVSVSQVEGSEGLYRLAIGSPLRSASAAKGKCGAVVIYEVSLSNGELNSLLLGDEILGDKDGEAGYSLKIVQGRYLAVASPGTNQRQGRVQLYHYHVDAMEWARADQEFEGEDEGDNFGFSIALAMDSETKLSLVVGAVYSSASGAGYVTSFEPT